MEDTRDGTAAGYFSTSGGSATNATPYQHPLNQASPSSPSSSFSSSRSQQDLPPKSPLRLAQSTSNLAATTTILNDMIAPSRHHRPPVRTISLEMPSRSRSPSPFIHPSPLPSPISPLSPIPSPTTAVMHEPHYNRIPSPSTASPTSPSSPSNAHSIFAFPLPRKKSRPHLPPRSRKTSHSEVESSSPTSPTSLESFKDSHPTSALLKHQGLPSMDDASLALLSSPTRPSFEPPPGFLSTPRGCGGQHIESDASVSLRTTSLVDSAMRQRGMDVDQELISGAVEKSGMAKRSMEVLTGWLRRKVRDESPGRLKLERDELGSQEEEMEDVRERYPYDCAVKGKMGEGYILPTPGPSPPMGTRRPPLPTRQSTRLQMSSATTLVDEEEGIHGMTLDVPVDDGGWWSAEELAVITRPVVRSRRVEGIDAVVMGRGVGRGEEMLRSAEGTVEMREILGRGRDVGLGLVFAATQREKDLQSLRMRVSISSSLSSLFSLGSHDDTSQVGEEANPCF
ncbi:hypothetical protein BC829DRAFT_447576 [Chytridium lagenaria]|nr:hypothetical protein BC829DRAFT_447576 [Chytridium lagenaria]